MKKSLVFKKYRNLKIGFSTHSFQKTVPLNVSGLTELIEYASNEGYHFMEVRDPQVDLSHDDCKELAAIAIINKIDIIYVFNKNILDSRFNEFFERGLANAIIFPGPGIMRTLVSKSEFDQDPERKGWNKEELVHITNLSESCAFKARSKNIHFIVENCNEAFFGNNLTYFGITDFLENAVGTDLQLDIGNLFSNTNRVDNDPEKVFKYLKTLKNRWVETHLKTIQNGEPQAILTDNPLPLEKIVDLMGKQNVLYLTLELAAVERKEQCFDNLASSIQFLRFKNILKS